MADVHHQSKEGSAVSDRMRYVPKPIAVRSENLVTSIKASNRSLFNGDGTTVTQVIFDSSYEWWVLFGHGSHTFFV